MSWPGACGDTVSQSKLLDVSNGCSNRIWSQEKKKLLKWKTAGINLRGCWIDICPHFSPYKTPTLIFNTCVLILKSSQFTFMDITLPPLTCLLHTIHHLFVCVMWTKWDPYLQTSDLLPRDTFNYKESTLATGSSALRQSSSAYLPSALSLNSLHISMPLAFMAYRWKSITVALHKNKTWWGVSLVASTWIGCGGEEGEGWLPKMVRFTQSATAKDKSSRFLHAC